MRHLLITTLLAACAQSTPIFTGTSDISSSLERRQVRCVITGTEGMDIDSTAPASGIAAFSPTGQLAIDCDNGLHWDSGSSLPISQTVSAQDSGLAQDVQWTQEWQTGGYVSCSVSYGNGDSIPGTVGAHDLTMTVGAGSTDTETCAAQFMV